MAGLHFQNYVGWLQEELEVRLRLEPCLHLSLAAWPWARGLTHWRIDFPISRMRTAPPSSHVSIKKDDASKPPGPQLGAISVPPAGPGAHWKGGFGRRPVGAGGVGEVSSQVGRPALALGHRSVLTL